MLTEPLTEADIGRRFVSAGGVIVKLSHWNESHHGCWIVRTKDGVNQWGVKPENGEYVLSRNGHREYDLVAVVYDECPF